MVDDSLFCFLGAPGADDYLHARLHGTVNYAHALPVTGCRECARVVGQLPRTLPIQCPPAWRTSDDLRPRRGQWHYRTNAEFAALRARLEPELPATMAPLLPLQPGDQFAPAQWRVPSWPTDDILWPEIGAALVSERLRLALEDAGVTGLSFAPVVVERFGNKPARRMAKARGGEPEDAWRRIPLPSKDVRPPVYWHLAVTARSRTGDLPVCPEWGHVRLESKVLQACLGDARWLQSTWTGTDFFRPLGAGYIAVTDRVRAIFESLGATGAAFRTPADALGNRDV